MLIRQFGRRITLTIQNGTIKREVLLKNENQKTEQVLNVDVKVDFTEDQIEDIKDGFDLYDRTGEGKLFFNQVSDIKIM